MAIYFGPRVVPWISHWSRDRFTQLFTLSVLLAAIALGIAFGSADFRRILCARGLLRRRRHERIDLSHRAAADSLPLQNAFSGTVFRLGRECFSTPRS